MVVNDVRDTMKFLLVERIFTIKPQIKGAIELLDNFLGYA
jgi:hypothetical protein